MKRTRIISILLAALLLVTAAAMPAFAAEVDFDKYIAEFTPNFFNDQSLEMGKSHKPTSSVWMGNEGAICQSSDESVVTVTEDGTVTAVGEGTAYVVYIASTGMYDTYRYTVSEASLAPTQEVEEEAEAPALPENLLPSAKPVLPETSDATASSSGLMGALGVIGVALTGIIAFLGTALAGILSMGGAFLLIIPIFAIAFYLLYRMIRLSKTSMQKRELPASVETENTVKAAVAARTVCPKCGKEFGDAEFCPSCGTAKQRKNVYTFPITKAMPAQKFEKMANQWFAENPYIYDCKLKIDYHSSLLSPLVDYKFFVKSATVEFSVADTPRKEQYGFAFLYKFWLFGPLGYSNEKHVSQWNKNNPDCTVVNQRGGRIQHLGSQSGFYAQYYSYILFRK